MAFNAGFRLLPPTASTFASRLDWLVGFLTLTSAALTLTVLGLVVYFGLRYRRRNEDEVPPKWVASRYLEIGASSFLLVLFMSMFAWGAVLYVDIKRPAPDALELNVIGRQWMWTLQHPGGQGEINEMHVPLGRPVKLTMTSLDVIHSFGVPAFRIKQDVLPNAYTTQWFTATKAGEYDLFCNEYCGTDHSRMRGRVVVLEPKDYDAWLAGMPADEPQVAAGARLFVAQGCVTCHGQNAPTLAGLYGRRERFDDGSTAVADDAYIRESILNPPARVVAGYARAMPSYRGQLNDGQVSAIVAYIKSLGAARTEGAGTVDASGPATRPVGDDVRRPIPNQPPTREPPTLRQTPPAGVKEAR